MPTWVDKLMNSQLVQLGLAALAFLIALWLVVVIARMLMGGRLRLPGGRTRQARLGIVDAFDLDRQRQLIIVRRDNTEHLIMIGGPNDLVIESEIVRVESRDFRDARRDKNMDAVNDVRVPAPFVAPTGDMVPQQVAAPQGSGSQGLGPQVNGVSAAARQEEPLLPMPLPQTAPPPDALVSAAPSIPVSVEPQTTRPTFPLPPRRPMASFPERRPPPPPAVPPPALPERIARLDEPEPPTLAPDVLPAPPMGRQQPMPPSSGDVLPTPKVDETLRPAPARPTPFSKPLPSRMPPRPLKRVTPQAEGADAAAAPEDMSGGSLPRKAPLFPPGLPPRPAPSAPAAKVEPSAGPLVEEDGLASLEEEMAKLLGR